ncbi:MAG: glycoside hydrolase family 9 protein [Acidobacteriota bacterium]
MWSLLAPLLALALVQTPSPVGPTGPLFLGLETADADVLVLRYRTDDRTPAPSQDPARYLVNDRPVMRVGRHSAPIYEERCTDWKAQRYPMLLEHRLYLELSEPLKEGTELRVRGPWGEHAERFSALTTRCESFKINQAGYGTRGQDRRAYLAAWLGDLGGRELKAKGPVELRVASDDTLIATIALGEPTTDQRAGGPARSLDLGVLSEPGSYYLSLPGVGRSASFPYGPAVAHHAFYVHARGFYHQRCGVPLEKPHTRWTRPACHETMRVTEGEPPGFIKLKEGPIRPSRGGHHDAGDFDHRLAHVLVPAWLMEAVELYPERFPDGQLDIPESGNGISDLLDEALFAIERWEVLQEDDGGVRAGTEARRHPTYGEVNAATDPLEYRTYRRDGFTTLSAAGLFAQASRLLRPRDPKRADALLRRAVKAWEFFERHRDGEEYRFTPGPRLRASCHLYLATGEEKYHAELKTQALYLCDKGPSRSKWPAQHAGTYYHLGLLRKGMIFTHDFFPYLLDHGRPVDEEVVAALRQRVISRANDTVKKLTKRSWAYLEAKGWGACTGVGRWGDQLVHAHYLTGKQVYLDHAGRLADFALGVNPAGWSFTTGLGHRPPYTPLQLDSYAHVRRGEAPVPGIVIYGVAEVGKSEHQKVVTRQVYPEFDSIPMLRRLTDGWSVVPQAEFTTYETMAPNTFLFAALAPETPLKGELLPVGTVGLPGGDPRGQLRP